MICSHHKSEKGGCGAEGFLDTSLRSVAKAFKNDIATLMQRHYKSLNRFMKEICNIACTLPARL